MQCHKGPNYHDKMIDFRNIIDANKHLSESESAHSEQMLLWFSMDPLLADTRFPCNPVLLSIGMVIEFPARALIFGH